jgi:hypothetical protein
MKTRFIEEPDGKIRIYPSRWNAAVMLLLCAGFLGFGIWVAIYARTVDVGLTITFSYVGVPLFLIIGVVLLRKLLGRDPAFEIDSTGIVDRSSFHALGHLRWDQIDFVVPYTFSGDAVLGVIPKDVQRLLDRQGVLTRSLVKLGHWRGSAPVNIPQAWLPMKVTELAHLLHTRFAVHIDADA